MITCEPIVQPATAFLLSDNSSCNVVKKRFKKYYFWRKSRLITWFDVERNIFICEVVRTIERPVMTKAFYMVLLFFGSGGILIADDWGRKDFQPILFLILFTLLSAIFIWNGQLANHTTFKRNYLNTFLQRRVYSNKQDLITSFFPENLTLESWI